MQNENMHREARKIGKYIFIEKAENVQEKNWQFFQFVQ